MGVRYPPLAMSSLIEDLINCKSNLSAKTINWLDSKANILADGIPEHI